MTHAFLYFLLILAVRTAIVAIFLAVGFRLLGKRQVGQMNIYDIALIMALANAVQNAMTSGAGDLSAGIVCAGTLLLLGRLAAAVFVRMPRLEQQLVGTPTTLIYNGQLFTARMRRECVSREQLMTALREHGVCDPSDCKIAVLEVDGSLSIVPKDQHETERSGAADSQRPQSSKTPDR